MHAVVEEFIHWNEKERESIAEVLERITTIMEGELYREEGHGSLFSFLRDKGKYSEGATMRRINAAKVISKEKGVLEKLRTGEVSLCALAKLGESMKHMDVLELLPKVEHKSKREVERMVLEHLPAEKRKKDSIKVVRVEALPALPILDSKSHRPESVTLHEIKVFVEESFMSLLHEAETYLGKKPVGEILHDALRELVRSKKPKTGQHRDWNKEGRHIPKVLRDEVFQRDNFQCSFVSADGVRCCETSGLQIDHIAPFSKGGRTERENLRTLCRAHNLLQAEREFGREVIHRHQERSKARASLMKKMPVSG